MPGLVFLAVTAGRIDGGRESDSGGEKMNQKRTWATGAVGQSRLAQVLIRRRRLLAAFSALSLLLTVVVTVGPVGSVVDEATAQTTLLCEPGHVYAISGDGQLRHANLTLGTPAVANVGTATGGTSNNGLAIQWDASVGGTSGSAAYIFERDSSNYRTGVLKVFNPGTGAWSNVDGTNLHGPSSMPTGYLVAGAFNPVDQSYTTVDMADRTTPITTSILLATRREIRRAIQPFS